MSDNLPTPLLTEILKRLPVKPLLRFRSVSKSWQSIIDDPNFINLHLKHSIQTQTNHTLIIKSCCISSVHFPTLDEQPQQVKHPLKSSDYPTSLVGTCNGLLCLFNGGYDEEEESFEEGTVIIYNPATRKHKELPFSPVEKKYLTWNEKRVYGFGYDQVHDDYKVVRISHFTGWIPGMYVNDVRVYSLKSHSWCKDDSFSLEYCISDKLSCGIYLNGCLHWVVNEKPGLSEGTDLIVAFNLGLNKWKLVPHNWYTESDEFCWNIGVLNGCLFVLCNYPGFKIDVWVMKKYGVKESWTKEFTVTQPTVLRRFEYVCPLAYSRDGSKVLLEKDFEDLVWFDLKSRRVERVDIRRMPQPMEAELLVESLVQVDSHKKKRKKKPKKRNEQSGQASSRLATLPVMLRFDILSRLPAKTLWQLRCVCKEWNDLIRDPYFAKMQFEVSGGSNDNLNLILKEDKVYMVDLNQLNRAVQNLQINHTLTCPEDWFDTVGLCNGLLCLCSPYYDIALWNPLTGSSYKLPISKFQLQKGSNMYQLFSHGFGYDPVTDDYKVVRVLQLYLRCDYGSDNFVDSEVQVFSLRKKNWRRIQSFPYIIWNPCTAVFANGALHWVARERGDMVTYSYVIMTFDVCSEKCGVVQQPSYDDIYFHMSLELLGGSLCILCHYAKCGVDIWVMKDYQRQSWVKLISIFDSKLIQAFEFFKPLLYSKNGGEVLLEWKYEKLIWYNLQKKTTRHVRISDLPSFSASVVFSGSLVDPAKFSGTSELDRGALSGTRNLSNNQRNISLLSQNTQGQFSNSLATFSEKLLSLIFSRLSVKTLLQVQCVCKTWFNIINAPEFIKSHLEVSRKCKSAMSLILKGDKFFSADFQLPDKAIEIKHPLFCNEETTSLVGASNGLICLHKEKDLVLWNPWTGKYEMLPSSNLQFSHVVHASHYFIHGFGYDPTNDDYKVVRILQHHNQLRGGMFNSEVQVYSLKTKSWGLVRHFPYFVCYPCMGTLSGGALHWVARQCPDLYSSSNLLIAFDLGMEKCREVTQPNYVDTDFHMSLGLLGDILCLLCHYPKQSFDLWLMTDCGTVSWRKLISISQPNIVGHFEYMRPLAFSEDRTEVLLEQDNEKLLWYNLKKKMAKYVKITGLPKSFQTVMCSRSLVPIGNATRKYKVIHEQPRKESQDRRDKKERDELRGFLSKGFKLKL